MGGLCNYKSAISENNEDELYNQLEVKKEYYDYSNFYVYEGTELSGNDLNLNTERSEGARKFRSGVAKKTNNEEEDEVEVEDGEEDDDMRFSHEFSISPKTPYSRITNTNDLNEVNYYGSSRIKEENKKKVEFQKDR